MSDVLFLAHRIPYPPNKGDKIRSWRWLEALTREHKVHLGAFIDDPNDWQHVGYLQGICASTHFESVRPMVARLTAILGAVGGRSLTEGFYKNSGMSSWVQQTVANNRIEAAFAFSSGVAPYVTEMVGQDTRRVLDLCDVDSDKWRQFAATTSWPMSQVHAFEHRHLEAAERRWVSECDSVMVAARGELELLERVVGRSNNVCVVGNGVDHGYFDPGVTHTNPFSADSVPIVFTGAMDYWANVEGAEWFARDVLARVRSEEPRALFAIVGSKPHARVLALAQLPGVMVTGSVPDVRPYIQHAHCVVAPLRIARGIQNKVLEGMAMGQRIVATPEAVAGIIAHAPDPPLTVATSPADFAAAVVRQLRVARESNGAARRYVRDHFDWGKTTQDFLSHVVPAARMSS